MKFSTITSFAVGAILPAIAYAQSNCVYSPCGAANEWCAAGARETMMIRLGCPPNGQSTNMVWLRPGITDAWYSNSPCAARINLQQSTGTTIMCGNAWYPFTDIISKCFVNGNNGIGWNQWSGRLYMTISTCAGYWSKRNLSVVSREAAEEFSKIDEGVSVPKMTREEELAGLTKYLLGDDIDSTITGKTIFTMPYSVTEPVEVCALAALMNSAELATKFLC